MKLLSRVRFVPFIALLVIGLMSSCEKQISSSQKENNVNLPELIELRSEVQSHDAFIALEASNALFFAQLRNKEIDLFTINSFLQMENERIDCANTNKYESSLEGYEKLAEAFCSKVTNLEQIRSDFPTLFTRTSADIQFVMTSKHNQMIATRVPDCLDQFQADWHHAESYQGNIPDHDLDIMERAVERYESCCEMYPDNPGCP